MVQLLRQYLAFVLTVFSVFASFAQETVSKEASILYLNKQLEQSDRLELKGKFLLVESSREGHIVKKDKINIYDLDPKAIRFVPEENMVVIRCLDDADGCVERTTIKVNRKSYRKRVTFGVSSKEHGQKVARALRHLINLHTDKSYEGTITLE